MEKGLRRGAGVTTQPWASPTNGGGFSDQWLPLRFEGPRGSAVVHCLGPFEVRCPLPSAVSLSRGSPGLQGTRYSGHAPSPGRWQGQAAAWSSRLQAGHLAPPLPLCRSSWSLRSRCHSLPPNTRGSWAHPAVRPALNASPRSSFPGKGSGRQARAQK